MAHPMHDSAREAHGDKLSAITGERGEYPPDRASRICGKPETNASAQGTAAQAPEEVFTAAPPRQVSNYGKVKGK